GWNSTLWELMKVGERCLNLNRLFNVREGFTREDDHLPRRFFTPFTSGPLEGVALDKEKLEQAKGVYFRMMGWDEEGVPTPGKLEELGIGEVGEI
ncbi:MAG: aldehyde ferredoxin oxidoreductase C-terminal domain-containing protein, partial [Nitrospinota bacterium]